MLQPDTRLTDDAFRQAAAEGVLVVPHCTDCDRTHWYPRPFCPHCHGTNVDWRPNAGRGSIYSFSIFRRAPEPYAIAYVAVDNGPVMLTNIVDCNFDDIAIGRRVVVRFHSFGGTELLPAFTLE